MKYFTSKNYLIFISSILVLCAFYYNYLYREPIEAQIIYLLGLNPFINLIFSILLFITFYIILKPNNKSEDKSNKIFYWLKKSANYLVVVMKSLLLVGVIYFLNSPKQILEIRALESNKNNVKKSINYSVISNKYMTYNHFKKYYLVLDTIENQYNFRIHVSDTCFEKYRIGDTIQIIYYKNNVISYIDYLKNPNMKCPKIINH